MKRKHIEKIKVLVGELEAHADINGVDTFYSREGQQMALRTAQKYLEHLRMFRPSTVEEAKTWDKLLVEYMDKVKRIEKAGERIERLTFGSESEKTQALEKLKLLTRRVEEAPIVKE